MTTFSDEQQKQQTGAFGWKDRLLGQITLTSPQGTTYTARWRQDQREIEKKVGVFDFPGVNGSIVQDLGTRGTKYPMTFYFDGPQNDLEAESFLNSMLESGVWSIEHPVYGFIELQPLRITQITNPVESGNITEFQTDWIEPLDEETLLTARQLFGVIDDLISDLNTAAAQSFVDETDTSEFGVEAATADQISRESVTASQALESLYNRSDTITSEVNLALAAIEEITDTTPLDTGDLAGYSQGVLQKPALGSSDIESRLDSYEQLTETLIAGLPSGTPNAENRNRLISTQLNLVSVVASMSQIVTTGDLGTRSQAVDSAVQIIDVWTSITDALDGGQTDYIDEDIDAQYFSQTNTFTITGNLVTAAVKFILAATFDLQIEKRFTLKEPKLPAQIVAEEFGTFGQTGVETDLIDRFISANKLKGNDILWLDAGREVVVYV